MASPTPSSSTPETMGLAATQTQQPVPNAPSTPESDSLLSNQSQPEPDSKPESEEGEDEEEGECGFCLFMKGGGCKDAFIAWEECVEAAEKSGENIVDKCFEVTAQLKKCMDAHADYYEPILRAEEALADSIAEEKSAEEKEKETREEEKEEKEKHESSE